MNLLKLSRELVIRKLLFAWMLFSSGAFLYAQELKNDTIRSRARFDRCKKKEIDAILESIMSNFCHDVCKKEVRYYVLVEFFKKGSFLSEKR